MDNQIIDRLLENQRIIDARLRDLETREYIQRTQHAALNLIKIGDVVAIGYSSANERGFLNKIINRTGHTSVKGELISCSTSADREAILQANEYDTFGVVAESGVAQGSEMWAWMTGSVAQVLYKNSVAATRGNILIAADTDGRAIDIANPGGGLPGTDTHFKECGHVMETKSAGTNVLVLAVLHFN